MIPQPKKDIVVEKAELFMFRIYVASDDAYEWIQQEAPKFGEYLKNSKGCHVLFINHCYDADEVKEHLETMPKID